MRNPHSIFRIVFKVGACSNDIIKVKHKDADLVLIERIAFRHSRGIGSKMFC